MRAGFPSPAEDFQAERIDVLKHIIVHPQATFTLRVRGVRGDLEAALECVLWGAGGQRERYFNWLRRRESGHGGAARRHSDGALLAYKRAIHAEVKGEYGWPRMHKELLARGIRVGKDRVRKLMQQHGIKARTKCKFVVTTDNRHSLPVAPDLVQRRFNPQAPNQLWSGDITYIPTDEGWLYLAAVIDLFSRQVVGWSLQPHMQAGLWSRMRWPWRGGAVGHQLG